MDRFFRRLRMQRSAPGVVDLRIAKCFSSWWPVPFLIFKSVAGQLVCGPRAYLEIRNITKFDWITMCLNISRMQILLTQSTSALSSRSHTAGLAVDGRLNSSEDAVGCLKNACFARCIAGKEIQKKEALFRLPSVTTPNNCAPFNHFMFMRNDPVTRIKWLKFSPGNAVARPQRFGAASRRPWQIL